MAWRVIVRSVRREARTSAGSAWVLPAAQLVRNVSACSVSVPGSAV